MYRPIISGLNICYLRLYTLRISRWFIRRALMYVLNSIFVWSKIVGRGCVPKGCHSGPSDRRVFFSFVQNSPSDWLCLCPVLCLIKMIYVRSRSTHLVTVDLTIIRPLQFSRRNDIRRSYVTRSTAALQCRCVLNRVSQHKCTDVHYWAAA